MSKEPIIPNLQLTVIIVNLSRLNYEEPPSYRSVIIDLTSEQLEKIKLGHCDTDRGHDYYESINTSFLEEKQS